MSKYFIDGNDNFMVLPDSGTAPTGWTEIDEVAAAPYLVVQQAESAAEQAIEEGSSKGLKELRRSGRVYCYVDARWVGPDSNYGPAWVQYSLTGGTGLEPSITWNQHGYYLKAGSILKDIIITGRANNNSPSDLETFVRIQGDFSGAGYDSAAETLAETVKHFTSLNRGAVPLNDMHSTTLDLEGYVVPRDCFLMVYHKPVSVSAATRYFYDTTVIRYSDPE